jgi:hypothetical protein
MIIGGSRMQWEACVVIDDKVYCWDVVKQQAVEVEPIPKDTVGVPISAQTKLLEKVLEVRRAQQGEQ